jgi:NAD(P)-dependent dehydrogenase (short-subunit alcohol dehydrogenase family)
MATTEKSKFDGIAYDAPLTLTEPTWWWRQKQNHKGGKSTKVSVPAADLAGKWVIISGSNNGIGREAAIQMAAWGANLILACRTPPPKETHPNDVVKECFAAAEKAGKKVEVEWWEIDNSDLASVEAFAQRWLETGRPLDILCNNAGMGSSPGGDKVFKTKDGFEIIHQVNFLAHVLLTLRLLPSLAKAKEPRVVCTTSSFHYLGEFDLSNWNGELGKAGNEGVHYYQNNKLNFQIWLTELQRRLLQHEEYKHITVNGCHPGYVNSGIWNLNKSDASAWKEWIGKFFARNLGIDTKQGSMALLHTATSDAAGPNPKTQGVGKEGGKGGGRFFNRIWEEDSMPYCHDADCRCRVWRKSDDELKLAEKGLLNVLGRDYVE